MPVFTEANQDAKSVDISKASMGPRVGFQESFAVSVDAQERASAQYGIENAMWEVEDKQYKAMKEAGIEDAPLLSPNSIGWFASNLPGPASDVDTYMDTARFYAEGGTPEQAEQLKTFDTKIDELKKQFPNLELRNSKEMFQTIRERAQEAEHKLNNQERTVGGAVGEFLGGALASMNPNTDPFNFLTLGVGGAGKTAAMRIASQVGAQGAIETVNQVTGVQEQRRIQGLSHGFRDAASRVAFTAAGAGVLQGGGEVLFKGAKRFFRNTKTDPAPTPPPEPQRLLEYKPDPVETVGVAARDVRPTYEPIMNQASPFLDTRAGRVRTRVDVDHVDRQLDSWDGPLASEIRPKTDTAIPKPVSEFVSPKIDTSVPGQRDLDRMAREVDPQLFRQYDKLAQRKAEYSRWLEEMRPDGDEIDAKLSAIVNRIDELTDVVSNPKTKARARKQAQTELDELKATKDEKAQDILRTDTPSMARVRSELMGTDFKMRDMAPLVSRAYARAKDEWDLGAEERALVQQMVREGRADLPKQPINPVQDLDPDVALSYARGLSDKAPILKQRAKVEGKVPVDADAADVASAIVKENMKVLDEANEQFRVLLDQAIDPKAKKLDLPGTDYKLDLDKDVVSVPNETGGGFKEISVRDYLKEQREVEYDLEAVKTCSIK